MKRVRRLILSVSVLCIFSVAPAMAQNAVSSTDSAMIAYDLSKEIKIQGTIQKIETSGTTAPIGTHILIQTSQGVVDAQLGFGSAAAPANLGLSEGQSVTVLGMMQAQGSNSVILARVLTTSSRVFVLRSERGIPVRTFPAANSRPASALKGTL